MTPALVVATLLLATGCQTTVSGYLSRRGRDFKDCFLIQTGLGIGLGVDVKAGGLVHASALMSAHFDEGTVGWVYGEPRPADELHATIVGHVSNEGDLGIGLIHVSARSYQDTSVGHVCFGVLPAAFSLHGGTWLWLDPDEEWAGLEKAVRSARIHAFDVEAGVMLLLWGFRAGFSPGEFLDFLLGWFGIDIAGDDAPAVTRERPAQECNRREHSRSSLGPRR
jgi:hypothetical protein